MIEKDRLQFFKDFYTPVAEQTGGSGGFALSWGRRNAAETLELVALTTTTCPAWMTRQLSS